VEIKTRRRGRKAENGKLKEEMKRKKGVKMKVKS